MGILIVDDEINTRTALRELLTRLGQKTILEARNGEEALKVLDMEKTRIQMMIVDWEMPYMDGLSLSERMASDPSFSLIPFLLITSDLPKSKLAAFYKKYPRVDGYLIKPFRMSSLETAMNEAHVRRCRTRDILVYFGTRESAEAWEGALFADSPESLEALVLEHSNRLGGILLDPTRVAGSPRVSEFLRAFSKTPLGTWIPWMCLSREPEEVFSLRTYCQFFVPRDADQKRCAIVLKQMAIRREAAWSIGLKLQEAKSLLQAKDLACARKVVQSMIDLDPDNSELHALMGDVIAGLGDMKTAANHYLRSIEGNPCLPRPYIKLLESSFLDESTRAHLASQAAGFCPQNQDVQKVARKIQENG